MARVSDVDPAAWTRFGPETPQVVYGPSEPQSRKLYDLEYFRTLSLYTHWREHNIALKFFRERGEQQGLDRIWFDTGKEQIAVINHPKGTEFTFDPAAGSFDWEWQQMVAQLHNDDLQPVVEGSGGRSRGIIACSLQKTDMYDHKRHHAWREISAAVAGHATPEFYIWDFVLWRADGSYIVMHPNYKNKKNRLQDDDADG